MLKALSIFSVVFAMNAHATPSKITFGDKVDLKCTDDKAGNDKHKVNITVKELGKIKRSEIPSEVPATFIDGLVEDKFVLREYEIKGKAQINPDGEVIFDLKLDTSFYGALSIPDFEDGFNESNIYGDYTKPVSALTLDKSYQGNGYDISLYYQAPGFASSVGLVCEGTLPGPETVRPGIKRAERYDRTFTCEVDAAKDFPATQFEMTVANLQNPRLLEAVEYNDTDGKFGWFVHGKDMEEHLVGKLNDGDAQILRIENNSKATPKKRLVSTYYDECGSFNCFSVELDLAFPEPKDKTIKGSFRYRVNEEQADGDSKAVLKSRADVVCKLK